MKPNRAELKSWYQYQRASIGRCAQCGYRDEPLPYKPCGGCGVEFSIFESGRYRSPGKQGSFDIEADYPPYRDSTTVTLRVPV
jgi:hypothetical protein